MMELYPCHSTLLNKDVFTILNFHQILLERFIRIRPHMLVIASWKHKNIPDLAPECDTKINKKNEVQIMFFQVNIVEYTLKKALFSFSPSRKELKRLTYRWQFI